MKEPWTLADILDCEFFFKNDETLVEQGREHEIEQRDREIYLATGSGAAPEDAPANRILATHWLAARRQDSRNRQAVLPGQVWRELTTLCAWIILGASLLCGSLISATFLLYSGVAPVNVSGYFAFFILLQLILLLCQSGLFGYRLLRRSDLRSAILYPLFAQALKKLFVKLYSRSQRSLGSARRLDLHATFGAIRQGQQLYGALFLWPTFLLLQLGGIGFNLGVLATTLAKVSFSDIAFGWQSTLPLTETFLAELIRWIALPWSWLVPEHLAYPTLEQIGGSRIILKDGIYHLATVDLSAWWPFLCLGVLTYGLLPRLLLFGAGRYRLAAKLRRFSYDSANFRQLRRRMLTPSIETAAAHAIPPFTAPAVPPPVQKKAFKPRADSRGWLLLIPDEIWNECSLEDLAPHLRRIGNDEPLLPLRYGSIDQQSAALLEQVAARLTAGNLAGIMLLQEAWQPPIREITTLLRRLRQIAAETTPLAIALIGKPGAGTALTPVQPIDLQIWLKTTKALADPYLEVFALVK